MVDERLQFVEECKLGEWSMAEACRRFEISRKTGYKWLARYECGGMEALKDQSHAPLSNPRQVLEEVEDAIVEARGKHSRWGPVKTTKSGPTRLWKEKHPPITIRTQSAPTTAAFVPSNTQPASRFAWWVRADRSAGMVPMCSWAGH